MEARGNGEDAPGWLLLYVIVAPQGGGSSDAAAATAAAVDAQGKIFWWLCADFYAKTPGDRCSLVSLYVDGPAPARGGDPKGSVSNGKIVGFVFVLSVSGRLVTVLGANLSGFRSSRAGPQLVLVGRSCFRLKCLPHWDEKQKRNKLWRVSINRVLSSFPCVSPPDNSRRVS